MIYEECDIHGFHVGSVCFYKCRKCGLYLCDDCYQNRRKHECILIDTDEDLWDD